MDEDYLNIFYVSIIAYLITMFSILECTQKRNVYIIQDAKYIQLQKKYKWLNKNLYDIVLENSKRYNIDHKYIIAIIDVESNGNHRAVGKSNDLGLMQVIPKYHYKNKNKNDLFIPEINIKVGCGYLRDCLNKAGGKKWLASIYYNAGMSCNISKYNRWWYIKKIIRNTNV